MRGKEKSVAAGPNAYRQAWRNLRGALVMAGLFSAAINVLMLTGSVYMLQVYDRVLSSGSIATLQGLFVIVVVLYAFLGLYEFLRTRLMTRAALRLDLTVGPEAFRVWMRSASGLETITPRDGSLRNDEPLRDLETLRGFLSGPAVMGLFDAPWVPLYFLILFMIHPWLGLVTLAGGAVVAMVAYLGRAMSARDMGEAMGMEAHERTFGEYARRSAEEVETLGMLGRIGMLWRNIHVAALVAGQRAGNINEAVSAFSKSFRMLLQSATLTVAALLVLDRQITGGMIVASSIIAGRALAPIDQIIGQWRAISRALVAHRRLDAYFQNRPAEPARIDLPAPTGQITVTRLTKMVPGAAPLSDRGRILNQVSFRLEAGDGLGVIGNSASGKSTLARLIVGAWRADAGEVRLDGATPDQWNPEVLGQSVGYLPQTLDLLPGTIRDNIARFDTTASDDAVIEAAKLAGVHEMILHLPAGYATRLGGAERPLSGGQIQRIGLARALFGNPRLIVLDEPNSNLDVSGDNALAQAIATMRERGSTVIVMAHRPSALAAVNKVLILHAGTVAAFGNKEEVLVAAMQGSETGAPPRPPVPTSGSQSSADHGEAQTAPMQTAAIRTGGKVRSDTKSMHIVSGLDVGTSSPGHVPVFRSVAMGKNHQTPSPGR